MSFTYEIKSDLLALENKNDCCNLAELCAIVCFSGTIADSKLKISSENTALIKRARYLIEKVTGIKHGISVTEGKNTHLVMNGEDNVNALCDILDLYDENYNGNVIFKISERIISSFCCKKAFLKGAFLCSGSMNSPEKAYHLEFSTSHYYLSYATINCLKAFGLKPKKIMRKSHYVVYFKDSEAIADVLNIIGAHRILMDFLNIKILKDRKNEINRVVNCEIANMDKVYSSAALQCSCIEKIQKTIGLEALPPTLYEIAKLRLDNREASLKELGEKLDPPISKSGVNHRIKKIIEIAQSI